MLISLILREFDLSSYSSGGGGRKGRRDGREWIRKRDGRGVDKMVDEVDKRGDAREEGGVLDGDGDSE